MILCMVVDFCISFHCSIVAPDAPEEIHHHWVGGSQNRVFTLGLQIGDKQILRTIHRHFGW